MLWEAIFMLVLLKIPVIYLCLVVWWAIRAEPRDPRPAILVPVSDTPPAGPGWGVGDRVRAPGSRAPRRPQPTRPRAGALRSDVRP